MNILPSLWFLSHSWSYCTSPPTLQGHRSLHFVSSKVCWYLLSGVISPIHFVLHIHTHLFLSYNFIGISGEARLAPACVSPGRMKVPLHSTTLGYIPICITSVPLINILYQTVSPLRQGLEMFLCISSGIVRLTYSKCFKPMCGFNVCWNWEERKPEMKGDGVGKLGNVIHW
jgi:hypothetical protein